MATKILINQIGQQLIADVKQVENKETKDVVGYWLTEPRLINYDTTEDGSVSVNFGTYCLVSADKEFSVRAEYIVSILDPREEVLERYSALATPATVEGETDESAALPVEDESDSDQPE